MMRRWIRNSPQGTARGHGIQELTCQRLPVSAVIRVPNSRSHGSKRHSQDLSSDAALTTAGLIHLQFPSDGHPGSLCLVEKVFKSASIWSSRKRLWPPLLPVLP